MARWAGFDKLSRWVWHKKKDRYTEKNLICTVNYSGASLMLWGCFLHPKALRTLWGYIASWTAPDLKIKSRCLCQDTTTGSWLNLPAGQLYKTSVRIQTKCFRDHRTKLVTWPSQSLDLKPNENLKRVEEERIYDTGGKIMRNGLWFLARYSPKYSSIIEDSVQLHCQKGVGYLT